jgi:rfaE bifunctional protein nucleotidyltransferase chain/domain
MSKIYSVADIQNVVKEIRKSSKDLRIVLCHGVFDLVHVGHLEHFQRSKAFGDFLIVSITSDEFVNKGPGRPFFTDTQRAEFLARIDLIDYVVISNEPSSSKIIERIQPDFYVKGEEYMDFEKDETGKILIEKETVEKFGGELKFTGGFRSSSTSLLNRSNFASNTDRNRWSNNILEKFSLEFMISCIDKLSEVNPTILGEIIIDKYSTCEALGRSAKHPLLVFNKRETSRHPGGSLAIADICANLCGNTDLVAVLPEGDSIIDEVLDTWTSKLNLIRFSERNLKHIVKHRFIDESTNARIFEYYDFEPRHFEDETYLKISNYLGGTNGPILIADYGHGFFKKSFIEQLCDSDFFLCVNTQTNAGNRGFNTISKYMRADLIALNGGELELDLRAKNLDYPSVVPEIMRMMSAKYSVVTLGKKGLMVFDSEGNYHSVPALTENVIDIVGAGDAVFSLASLLAYINAPLEVIGFGAAISAAHEILSLGHQRGLSLVDLKRHVRGIFG